ncbi:hypothetical protein F5148DRAFT_1147222 [Russula earlei]|uniref:Uncharacterized protein n=1 Tax=Russula earlei TaxID=71964 RepID=A0ACC0UH20_9AGAM|nr:hypothetical protein F5148DRAFT_1147222 [Russula earlei]
MPCILAWSSSCPLRSSASTLTTTAPTYKGPSVSPAATSCFASIAARHPVRLQHAPTLTVLHTARELLARVLPPQSPELSFWNAVLCKVSDEISRSSLTSNREHVTIVVYAVDEFSGGESLVSALIEDPFSPEVESARISKRWEAHEQDSRLEIEHASSPVDVPDGPAPSSSHRLRLSSSSFLASMPFPTRLIELRPTRELLQDDLRLLYTADIPIILLNPLTTPLTTLSPHTSSNPNPLVLPYPFPQHGLLLIASPSPISTSSSVPPIVSELGVSPNRVFLVDPDRALSSIKTLRVNPSDVSHIQRYSDDARASGLSILKHQLQSVPTPMQKGDALVIATVSVLRDRLNGCEAETRDAAALAHALRSEISREHEDAYRAVFGPASEQPGSTSADHGSNKVRAAMTRADDEVLPVLSHMVWWRVLWAPDEVGWRMRQAVRDAWVGSVASGLLPALAALPSTQTAQARTRPLAGRGASGVAALTRAAQRAEPTHACALLCPRSAHAAPLARTPCRAARFWPDCRARARGAGPASAYRWQRAMIFTHGVGEAAGAGLFVVATGIRWAIGRWDKMRKAWMADWVRVKEAAERDVKVPLDQALETRVLIVPTRAAEGIEGIVAKREDELKQWRRDVNELDAVIPDSLKSRA